MIKIKRKIILVVLLIIITCSLYLGCTIIAVSVYSHAFARVNEFSEKLFRPYYTLKEINQKGYLHEEVFFNSGKNKLQGFIFGSQNDKGLIVISQGLGSTVTNYFNLIMNFVDNGWRVFAYNNTGVGGSEGNSVRGLTQSVIDLDAALTFVKNTGSFNGLPVMLAGHSWGGYAVCAVLNFDHHSINAVVSFAGYNIANHVIKERGVSMAGGIYYLITPQVCIIEQIMFGNKAKLTAVDGINNTNIPIMIVQCSDDDIISADNTSIYAHRAKITNPNVIIYYREGNEATGHEYPFCSTEQRDYMIKAQNSFAAYKAENKNACRLTWAKEFNFNKELANQLDTSLMISINELFDNVR